MKLSVLSLVVILPTGAFALDKVDSFLRNADIGSIVSARNKRQSSSRGESTIRQLQFWFSPGEIACQRDLEKCETANPLGSVNLDYWEDFLTDEDTGNEEDKTSTISEIRDILAEATSVATEYWESVGTISAEDREKLVAALPSITDSLELESGVIENGLEDFGLDDLNNKILLGFFQWWHDFYNAIIGIPVVGGWFGNFVNKLVSFMSKRVGSFDSTAATVNHTFGAVMEAIVGLVGLVTSSQARVYTGFPFMQSSRQCEAELFSCEYEAFLADTIPKLLSLGLIGAGVLQP